MDTYRVLSPIWTIRRETAQRIRQRIKSVLDWSKVAGFRTGENAVDGTAKALPKARPEAKHHRALPYRDVPAFIVSLREFNTSESMKLAFEFTTLTAGRTKEVIEALWDEIDFDEKMWTVPGTRTQGGREHRVDNVSPQPTIRGSIPADRGYDCRRALPARRDRRLEHGPDR